MLHRVRIRVKHTGHMSQLWDVSIQLVSKCSVQESVLGKGDRAERGIHHRARYQLCYAKHMFLAAGASKQGQVETISAGCH